MWSRDTPEPSLRSPPRALPTETKVESGMSQSKSGTSVNSSNSGIRAGTHPLVFASESGVEGVLPRHGRLDEPRPPSSHGKCLESRFAKVNSRTIQSTYSFCR